MDGTTLALVATCTATAAVALLCDDALLDKRAVAAMLSVPAKRVYALYGMPVVRLGTRTLRWRLGDVRAFIRARVTQEGGSGGLPAR